MSRMGKINWDKVGCFFLGHNWSMYAGFEQIRVHPRAYCERCGIKAREGKDYN